MQVISPAVDSVFQMPFIAKQWKYESIVLFETSETLLYPGNQYSFIA